MGNRPAKFGNWNSSAVARHTCTCGWRRQPPAGGLGQPFRVWLSHAWTDVVAHPDPAERARHLLAGTAVDLLNGLRASDLKRLAIYSISTHHQPLSETRNTNI